MLLSDFIEDLLKLQRELGEAEVVIKNPHAKAMCDIKQPPNLSVEKFERTDLHNSNWVKQVVISQER